MALPRPLLDHFATHHGVASRAVLGQHGITPRRIDTLLRSGAIELVHRRVYRLGGSPPTPLQRIAALCASDGRIVASHTTAGRLWGWRKMGDPDDLTILVPGVTSPKLGGVSIHRCHLIDATHWKERPDGIRVTTPARTIFDLARVLSDRALESVIEQAIDQRVASIPTLYTIGRALRASGRDGSARFGRVLDARPAWRAPVGSDLELKVERALLAIGLTAAVRQAKIPLPDGTVIRPDLYWPDLRLVVEVDHVTWHGGRVDSTRDKRRDRQLRRLGIETIRVSDTDVTERLRSVAEDVAVVLRSRLSGPATTETGVADRQSG